MWAVLVFTQPLLSASGSLQWIHICLQPLLTNVVHKILFQIFWNYKLRCPQFYQLAVWFAGVTGRDIAELFVFNQSTMYSLVWILVLDSTLFINQWMEYNPQNDYPSGRVHEQLICSFVSHCGLCTNKVDRWLSDLYILQHAFVNFKFFQS